MKKSYVLLSLCFLFIGCSSIPKETISLHPVDELEPFIYEPGDISVSIDYVKESVIAEQVTTLMSTVFSKNTENQNDENIIYIDFNVVQRSFIQNINQKNTIYINVIGYDSDNSIILRDNFYLTGDQTFISSVVQYKYVNKVIKNLLKYQKSVNKNYLKRIKNAEKENL